MGKILLVGNFTEIYRDINGCLSEKHQVQMCPFDLKSLEGITKIAKPDLTLLCMVNVDDGSAKIFDFLNNRKVTTPVLLIISKEDFAKVKTFCGKDFYHAIYTPCKNPEILAVCDQILSPLENVGDSSFTNTSGAEVTNKKKWRRKNILVVDDTPVMLRSINEMLKDRFSVTLATSGKEALKFIVEDMPDLVLLDYKMPEMDGSETFKKIREIAGNGLPVIFLTGVSDKEKIVEILKHRPDGYILKPPDRDLLIDSINKALRKNEV